MITKNQVDTSPKTVTAGQKPKTKPTPVATKKPVTVVPKPVVFKPAKPKVKAPKSPEGNLISIRNYSVKLGNRLSAASFSQRVREIVLPELSSKAEERRGGSILKLILNASPTDPFGDRDFAALLKGPITITVLDSLSKPLAAKTFKVTSVVRANAKLELCPLPDCGIEHSLLHHFTLSVQPLSDLKIA